jgi:hypothetical protein
MVRLIGRQSGLCDESQDLRDELQRHDHTSGLEYERVEARRLWFSDVLAAADRGMVLLLPVGVCIAASNPQAARHAPRPRPVGGRDVRRQLPDASGLPLPDEAWAFMDRTGDASNHLLHSGGCDRGLSRRGGDVSEPPARLAGLARALCAGHISSLPLVQPVLQR